MKTLNLTFMLLLFAAVSYSQVTEDWVRKYSTTQNSIQESYDAVSDINGNVYVAGRTSLGFSGYDMVLLKYNSAGNYVWGKTFHRDSLWYSDDAAYSLVQFKTGDSIYIYVTGVSTYSGKLMVFKYNQNGVLIWKKIVSGFINVSNPVTHVDASGTCYSAGGNGANAFLVIHNAAGLMLNYATFTNPSGHSLSVWNAIASDASGNIFLSGKIDSSKGKYLTAKYNSGGFLQWSKMYRGAGNLNCSSNDIAVGASGNVYVTGEFDNGNHDYLTVKYNGTTGDTIWTRKFNGSANGNDLGRCIEVDASENIFVTGLTNRGSNGSIATLKYNSSGTLQWTRTYSGLSALQDEPTDMSRDASGNIVIAGVSDSSAAENTLAIKYNTNGDSLWVRNYSFTTNDYERPASIHLDNSSNVILTGYCSNPDQRDFATLKYNSSGVLQWARKYYGAQYTNDRANSVTTDKKGNVYTIGKYQTNHGENFVITKYNSAGVLKWAYENVFPFYDEGFDIKVDTNGFVYYTCTVAENKSVNNHFAWGKLDSNGGSYHFYSHFVGNYDVPVACELDNAGNLYIIGKSFFSGANRFILIKIAPGGVNAWQRYYGDNFAGNDIPKSVAVDPSGNIYVSGTSDTTGVGSDIVTLKYNSNGDLLWSKRVNGSSNGNDVAANVVTDNGGNVYVGGTKTESVGGEMGVVLKYNTAGTLRWTKTVNLNASTGAEAIVAIRTDTSKTKIFAAGYSIITGLLNADYTITKFDSAGTQIWQNTYDNINPFYDQTLGLAVDKNENSYLTGNTLLPTNDILTVSFDNNGTFKWSKVYNTSTSTDDKVTGHNPVAVDLNGNVFVAGSSYDTLYGNMMTTIKYKPQAALTLNLTAFIQGFYDQSSNTMISDSLRIHLRNISSPYSIVDSSKGVLNSSGNKIFNFNNVSNGINYYIVARHRNSIETWSAAGNQFISGAMTFNFSTSASTAYGSNQIQSDASPLRFAIYSGDVNQDGTIDLSDGSLIDNDAFNFESGYVQTDVNGDGIVDVADAVFADNNGFNFISMIRP